MTRRLVARPPAAAPLNTLAADFDAIRAELGIRDAFPDAALAEAAAATRRSPRDGRSDRTDIPFVTIDPPGSRDLDQALQIEPAQDGFLVRYAIADVGFFVARGGALEAEAFTRGVTAYAPDRRAPLYPPSLCEGAASLLPEEERPAIVFEARLDAAGAIADFQLARSLVRSRRQMTYREAQDEGVPGLEQVGELRDRQERERGGVRLDLPAQEIVPDAAAPAGFLLRWEQRLPVEDWNAQISLLTGLGAAGRMRDAGVGLLRIMDPPDAGRLRAARAGARLLGIRWPTGKGVAQVVRSLDGGIPKQEAMLILLRRAMGRARYAAFDGEPPAEEHAALAGPYAHVTAPLRRLADRYSLDLLCTLAAGGRPTAAEVETLTRLPAVMARAESRAGRLERALIDAVESRLLEPRIGETFPAVVLSSDGGEARIQIAEPAVLATLVDPTPPAPGTRVCVRLASIDPVKRRLEFAPSG